MLTGDEASEDRVRTLALDSFDTVVFATHALVAGEMEGVAEPGLDLARPAPNARNDGVLTASEIASLKFDADWVILSACNTAAGDSPSGAAFSGLAQAFGFAGSRALLVSQWSVLDDAAAYINTRAVTLARTGVSRARALRRAMLDLIDNSGPPEHAEPYLWAPFVLLEM